MTDRFLCPGEKSKQAFGLPYAKPSHKRRAADDQQHASAKRPHARCFLDLACTALPSHPHTLTHTHTHTHARTHAYTHTYLHTHTRTHAQNPSVSLACKLGPVGNGATSWAKGGRRLVAARSLTVFLLYQNHPV